MHKSKSTIRGLTTFGRLSGIVHTLAWVGTALIFATASSAADSTRGGDHHTAPGAKPPPPFVASTAKTFAQLMADAMGVMDYGMRAAPMSGEPSHDFVTMMIPHHQGAIDMAKALLLYTKDPALINLAQGIITEQQNEIRLMQSWLERHTAVAPRLDRKKH